MALRSRTLPVLIGGNVTQWGSSLVRELESKFYEDSQDSIDNISTGFTSTTLTSVERVLILVSGNTVGDVTVLRGSDELASLPGVNGYFSWHVLTTSSGNTEVYDVVSTGPIVDSVITTLELK